MTYTKENLVDIGIEKLKNYGFINVNRGNVFSDDVYKYHFQKFIFMMLGQDNALDIIIRELFTSIDNKKNEHI